MWFLLFLAFVGCLCIADRWLYFHRSRINISDFLLGIAQHVRSNEIQEALQETAKIPGPAARVAHTILLRHTLKRSDLRDIAQEAGQLEIPRIESRIRGILAIALLSPMIGILGTLLGLLETFQRFSQQNGYAGPAEISGGVFQALLLSIVGVTLATIFYLFYLFYVAKARRLVHRIERTGIEMINIICDAREKSTSPSPETQP